ncbi:hypothetical protein ACFLZY_02650 [Patescibacteria group bacterium]
MITPPIPINRRQDKDTIEERVRKWLFYADSTYFGTRSCFLNGYNIPALNCANYTIEHYFKSILSLFEISWNGCGDGHNLKLLHGLLNDNVQNEIGLTNNEKEWLFLELQKYFEVRYPDSLPKKEIVWRFRINEFDTIVRKIRNALLNFSNEREIPIGTFDPIRNALDLKEIFDESMVQRRRGTHHSNVFSNLNKEKSDFLTYSDETHYLPMS